MNLARRSDLGSSAGAGGSVQSSTKPKSNPFGSATAVDTASKFAAIELKEREEKELQKQKRQEDDDNAKKENPPADDEQEEAKEETGEEEATSNNEIVDTEEPEGENVDEEDDEDEEEQANDKDADGDSTKDKRRDRGGRNRGGRKIFEPKVVNSRAAMLDAAAAPKKEVRDKLENEFA